MRGIHLKNINQSAAGGQIAFNKRVQRLLNKGIQDSISSALPGIMIMEKPDKQVAVWFAVGSELNDKSLLHIANNIAPPVAPQPKVTDNLRHIFTSVLDAMCTMAKGGMRRVLLICSQQTQISSPQAGEPPDDVACHGQYSPTSSVLKWPSSLSEHGYASALPHLYRSRCRLLVIGS